MTSDESFSPWVQRAREHRLPIGVGGEVPDRGGRLPYPTPRGGLMARIEGIRNNEVAVPIGDDTVVRPVGGIRGWKLFQRVTR